MTTGQTILTIGAFMFLTTILLNFYRVAAETGDSIASGQDGILATTIAVSYSEIAQGLAFDDVTDSTSAAIASPTLLTAAANLGPEAGEDSIYDYNDFARKAGHRDKPAVPDAVHGLLRQSRQHQPDLLGTHVRQEDGSEDLAHLTAAGIPRRDRYRTDIPCPRLLPL
jgi:hypothetical protein